MFVLQDASATSELRLGAMELEAQYYEQPGAKFDLTLSVSTRSEGSWQVSVEYCSALFEASTMERLVEHYERLLAAVLQDGDRAIGSIELLSAAEREQLLLEFNDTEVDYPKEKTIVDLFEQQVERTPNNIAVVFEEEQLTY